MKRTLNTVLTGLTMLLITAGDELARRTARLTEQPERGGGRGSIEEVMLTIGGYTAAGLAVAAVTAFVVSKLGLLQ